MRFFFSKIASILKIAPYLPKTIIFNLWYFGIKGIRLPIIFAAPVEFRSLGGTIELSVFRFGIVKFGQGRVGVISRHEEIVWENSGQIHFQGRATFGPAVKICTAGKLSFGDDFQARGRCSIVAWNNVSFGSGTLLSWDTTIMDTDFHEITIDGVERPRSIPIHVGDKVWLCAGCMVLKGSEIPNGSLVAARSVVTNAFKAQNLLLAGTPARKIKEGITWVQ